MKTLIYYALAIISQLFFLKSFFPVSETGDTVKIERPKSLGDIGFNETFRHTPLTDKIIFVVIDALRLDFFTPQHMPFLYKTAEKTGCNFTVHVQSPTVTLPRIKSLTTGRVPQFSDILFNLGSAGVVKDSFLHQAVEKGKKITFYGDDTWLRIYPELFARSEGVSSFFVNDFTEVDYNVTKNLNRELETTDWDVLFLHYLGLDHIGHVFGPNSKLIPEKLREMDALIQRVHEKSQQWNENLVIFVSGDHGMKDSGGHGGSTFAETHVPLVVLNRKCSGGQVEQIDVAPSLSAFLGVDIPAGSVGKIITNFLSPVDIRFQNYLLLYNSLVLNSASQEFEEILMEAKRFHYSFLKNSSFNHADLAVRAYESYLKETSELLVKKFAEQNTKALFISLLFIFFCFTLILSRAFKKTFQTYLQFQKNPPLFNLNIAIAILTLSHVFALTSSSLIEEEHQIWYFFLTTFVLLASLGSYKYILAAAVFRFLRTLNQTGDKWALLPDTADWLLAEEHYLHLQLFFVSSLFLVWLCCYRFHSNIFINTLNAITLFSIYCLKSVFTNSIFLGRLIWFTIFLNIIICNYTKNTFINSWLLIVSLLLRDYNVILLPACVFISDLICNGDFNVFTKITLHYWLGNAFYFCQGHSNSFASADVSVGYIGLENHIPSIVVAQVLCHTYALPALSHMLLFKNCIKDRRQCWNILVVWKMLCLISVDCVTLLHRHHLFIWSVFAPKLLIESCLSVLLLLEVLVSFLSVKLFQKYIHSFYLRLQRSN